MPVRPKILKKDDKDLYIGTLLPSKVEMIEEDKEIIIAEIRKNNGVLRLSKNSSPELIKEKLNMSKRAFKDAIGGLYKERIIVIEENSIKFTDKK